MKKSNLLRVGIDRIRSLDESDVRDGCVFFHTDIKRHFSENNSMRVDMLTFVICTRGSSQMEIDGILYMLERNEILVCSPNHIINNRMMSDDFDGKILCMAQRGVLDQISESGLWKKAFSFIDNPVISVSEETIRLLELYGEVLLTKTAMAKTPYHNEILFSIVKAVLYEMLANVNVRQDHDSSIDVMSQKEVQFKRFIKLLSDCRIKPRSVGWYADQLCITPKYLSTLCRQVSGKTAFDWINKFVLMDIRYWLKNTDKSIKEIAGLLNFPSLSFFGKYCRHHLGISPTEYRKRLRERN